MARRVAALAVVADPAVVDVAARVLVAAVRERVVVAQAAAAVVRAVLVVARDVDADPAVRVARQAAVAMVVADAMAVAVRRRSANRVIWSKT